MIVMTDRKDGSVVIKEHSNVRDSAKFIAENSRLVVIDRDAVERAADEVCISL